MQDRFVIESRNRRRLPPPEVRRLLRVRAGLSQAELAEAVGVSRVAVTRWEGGHRTPRGDRLANYLVVLDKLTAELAGTL